MKKYLIFLILILGCTSDAPENLISEQKMESIIFDIMILNASYNYESRTSVLGGKKESQKVWGGIIH